MARGDPEFLNVDLDLESREPLGRLADALSLTVSARIRGRYVMTLEGSWPTVSLDQTLRRLTKMISSLSGEPRRLWQLAAKRSFNIGFACGSRRGPPFEITATMVRAAAKCDGSFEITLYPYEKTASRAPRRSARR